MSFYVLFAFGFLVFLFVYGNFLYPIFVACCGLLMRQVTASQESEVKGLQPLTLLVPAYNEAAVIKAKLCNIDSLVYPEGLLSVVVASDGSSDGTQEIVNSHTSKVPRKLLDFKERRGKASIVNDAIEQCTDPWICLCDANVMFRPDALIRMGQRLQTPGVGAVTGDVRLASEDSDFGRGESLYYVVERAMQKGESLIGSVMGVDGGMYLMKRELFRPVEKDTILDDFTVSMRVIQQGQRIQYEPLAIADENATPSSEAEYTRRKRVIKGAVQSIYRGIFPSVMGQPVEFMQWVSHKLLRWLNPLVILGIIATSALLAPTSIWFSMLLGLEMLAIGLSVLAWYVPKLRDLPVLGILYYFSLSHWAMLIGFFQGLSGKYSAVWNRTERKPISS